MSAGSSLHAPWRIEYIRSLEGGADGACFLCQAAAAAAAGADAAARRAALLVWSTPLSIVIVNRFPYTNGHLLVAPRQHKPDLQDLTADELLDVQQQTVRAVRLLKRAVSAQGFNIGINLGRSAGAGLPGHLHQHVVPRWGGDTNFMSVVGDVRVVPQAIEQLYQELLSSHAQESMDQ